MSKPTFALWHTGTNACNWKLYVHFGTWKHLVDILGTYYILHELDVCVFISFSQGEFSSFKWVYNG